MESLPKEIQILILTIDDTTLIKSLYLNKYYNKLLSLYFELYKLTHIIRQNEILNCIESKPKFYSVISEKLGELNYIHFKILDNSHYDIQTFIYYQFNDGPEKNYCFHRIIYNSLYSTIDYENIDIFCKYDIYIKRGCNSVNIKNILLNELKNIKINTFIELIKHFIYLKHMCFLKTDNFDLNYETIWENSKWRDSKLIIECIKKEIVMMNNYLIDLIINL